MTVHMTEAEVARDLHTVLDKVRQGMESSSKKAVSCCHRDLFAHGGGTRPWHLGACGLELGYAIGTINIRDFNRIPDLNIDRL